MKQFTRGVISTYCALLPWSTDLTGQEVMNRTILLLRYIVIYSYVCITYVCYASFVLSLNLYSLLSFLIFRQDVTHIKDKQSALALHLCFFCVYVFESTASWRRWEWMSERWLRWEAVCLWSEDVADCLCWVILDLMLMCCCVCGGSELKEAEGKMGR